MVHLTPNPSYSLSLKIEIPNQAGTFASVLNAIADVGGI
ncbi:NADP-dependent malic enzyme [Microcystis panniformis FACHB-1757]|uniref:NADP-dependent malic enzyme n=1 Tax=Microcystis panniformis FACHB-1757 TaxID=1638788 RepID=A0A0K1RUN9_9CHRO|nr:NADP-dependent malic enzyme [Microcystis panniformis FACHB-1757]